MGCFLEYAYHRQALSSPPDPYHALVTLDHEAFILVQATDTADNIIVLLMPILLLRDWGLTAVCLTCCFSHNLINLGWCLMPCIVIGLSEAANISSNWGFTPVVLLKKEERNVWPSQFGSKIYLKRLYDFLSLPFWLTDFLEHLT